MAKAKVTKLNLPRVPLPRQTGGAHQDTPARRAARVWRKRKHKGKEDEG